MTDNSESPDACTIQDCDGEYVYEDGTKYCDTCHYAPTKQPSTNQKGVWESFWSHRRDNYSGFYGQERVRMIGGFFNPYDIYKSE
jgi:hypothetical protein